MYTKRPFARNLNFNYDGYSSEKAKLYGVDCLSLRNVRANCSAHANSHATSYTGARAMIGHVAIAITMPGFSSLGRSVTPLFFPKSDLIKNYLHVIQK